MKKFVYSLTVLFLSVAIIFPAVADFNASIEEKYKKITSWHADFIQTTFIEMLEQNLDKKGTIHAERPNKIKIEYLTEPQKIYVTNGSKLWIYKKDKKTAVQFDDPNRMIDKEALSFLNGLQNMSELFNVFDNLKEPDEYFKIKNQNLKKLFLLPKNENSSVLRIVIGVNAESLLVEEAVLFNISGNVTYYQFQNIKTDEKFPANHFELPDQPKRKIIKK